MTLCRFCHAPLDEEIARRSFYPSQVIDQGICNGCRRDDADDFAGITREEARAEEMGMRFEEEEQTEREG